MTTEQKPTYTVADLRRWAANYRIYALCGGSAEHPASLCLAMASAFDALAAGMEACDKRPTRCPDAYEEGDMDARAVIGRILSGVKP